MTTTNPSLLGISGFAARDVRVPISVDLLAERVLWQRSPGMRPHMQAPKSLLRRSTVPLSFVLPGGQNVRSQDVKNWVESPLYLGPEEGFFGSCLSGKRAKPQQIIKPGEIFTKTRR